MVEKTQEICFDEVAEQNKWRMRYCKHCEQINDQAFYQETLFAKWYAYRKYELNQGILATYFNNTIRNRMIESIQVGEQKQKGMDIND